MNNNEILPSPEQPNNRGLESVDNSNEKDLNIATEQKSNSVSGSGALSAVGIDDAQSQVSGATTSGTSAMSAVVSTQVDVPEVAEDVDLIEKEWVKRAKDIVNSTIGDPHTQNNQINRMKVDYIKKRYNKNIKFKEE
jgi:hypothetical protein